jgi:AraC-like DNA-binding protein
MVGAQEAYDFWCDTVFYNFNAIRKPEKEFSAIVKGVVSRRGAFFTYNSDEMTGARTTEHISRDGDDEINLGVVLAGTRQQAEGDDTETNAGAGDLFFYNAATPSRIRWSRHRGLHLCLPLAEVGSGIGKISASEAVRHLSASRLAPFLKNQLTLLAQNLDNLSTDEQAVMLQSSIDLAVTTLRSALLPDGVAWQDGDGLLVAACQYIDEHLADRNLDPAHIVQALGCSRATLYRRFADRDLTIAGYVREMRLQKMMSLLKSAPKSVAISQIAHAVGFSDSVSAIQMFRKRFGGRPRDFRQIT